jgi:hypothetical protein
MINERGGAGDHDMMSAGMNERQLRDGRAIARQTQCAPAVLMVRPAHFGFNRQTAHSNRFQLDTRTADSSTTRALPEFAALHGALQDCGVRTCVIEDTREPVKPDAVFPNNWVSFHEDGTVVLYPMQAENRRRERRMDVLEAVERELGFHRRRLLDLSREEVKGRYLEGTGSLVLDHVQRVAYACRSARTDESLVREWASAMGYEAEVFDATGSDGTPLYHTNVMLAIGSRQAVLCSEAVQTSDRRRVRARLQASGRQLVEISMRAMYAFAGNVLELRAHTGASATQSVLVMSSSARAALDEQQWVQLSTAVDRVLEASIPTIQSVGGGGVRCMLAEVPESLP